MQIDLVPYLTLFGAIVVHAAIIARWSGRLHTLVELQQQELKELRNIVKRHEGMLTNLTISMEVERRLRTGDGGE